MMRPGATVPSLAIRELAASLPRGTGVTLDLAAAREVGAPIVHVWDARADAMLHSLSPREQEVALLVGRGLRNKEIAVELGIAESTVKDHVHHILTKAGLASRAEIISSLTTRR
jgi:DNA-binding NarL/FixJ family response regulator